MAYVFVEDFKYGMDRRRPRFAGIPGTLWDAENVHLTRGGDIEGAKAFVPIHTGLENTFGLAELDGRRFVFGSADLTATVPPGVEYQRLQSVSGADMVDVLDVERFDGKLYVIAEYEDGSRHHFYDGVRVADWDTLAADIANRPLFLSSLAETLSGHDSVVARPTDTGVILRSIVPGQGYTLSVLYPNGGATDDQTTTITGLVANQAAEPATAPETTLTVTAGSFDPGVNQLTYLRVGAEPTGRVDLIGGPVDWVGSNEATANAVSVAINDNTEAHGYSAVPDGDTVTIIGPAGAQVNGHYLTYDSSGDAAFVDGGPLAGGANAVEAVAQQTLVEFGGTWEAEDTAEVMIDSSIYRVSGISAAMGRQVHVQDNRVWAVAGPALCYCALNDPTDWLDETATVGAGRIVVSTDTSGAQRLTGVESYQEQTAVFGEEAIVIYRLGTDPDEFEVTQKLPNSGTISGDAVRAYGASDVFYLDSTGVRSLQARDSSNAAFVSDAGTVFDPYVQALVGSMSLGQVRRAESTIEPTTGAYWLALGDQILVLTNFPGTGIRGWTRYTPGFTPTAFARSARSLLVRDAGTIYAYGGLDGVTYPGRGEMPARIRLPFLTARDDAGFKHLMGFDLGAEGTWRVTALVNPNDEQETIEAGIFADVTYSDENADMIGETTHVAFDMECSSAGRRLLANMAVHHQGRLRA